MRYTFLHYFVLIIILSSFLGKITHIKHLKHKEEIK